MRSVLKNHVDGRSFHLIGDSCFNLYCFVGHAVPIPHFGVVLEWDAMNELVDNMKKHQVKFEIEPYTRFEGLPGEQKTMVRLISFHSQIPHLNMTL